MGDTGARIVYVATKGHAKTPQCGVFVLATGHFSFLLALVFFLSASEVIIESILKLIVLKLSLSLK